MDSRVCFTDCRIAETAHTLVLHEQHAAPLWRHAPPSTSDRACTENVVQAKLLRAWQHPEIADDIKRSAITR
ncbi:hypothetical protein [Mycobacterium intracellulare]|uniref:hypothetical protein n=1 Tax=Mycobacterium intracellulare TaxID=1767 RepID=UPI001041EC53|nr:hypothetical protein [Mycobacterium intracellulare]